MLMSANTRKKSRSAKMRLLSCTILYGLFSGLGGVAHAQSASPAATQLPVGGQVTSGAASIVVNQGGAAPTMIVTQATERAIINWTGFDIGSAASVNFVQPDANSVALNRVSSLNPTQIYGNLTANGQVYLVNPNGVYFSKSARVDVGGLVATSLDISNNDFESGKAVFRSSRNSGSVVNDGNLTAQIDGYIAMLAPEVRKDRKSVV